MGGDLKSGGVWREIIKIGEELGELGIEFPTSFVADVGNGIDIGFWIDTWIGGSKLCDSFPRLYHLDRRKEARVAEKGKWVDNEWQCEWDWDTWRWTLQEDGKFTVNALTKMVEERLFRIPVRVELDKRGIDLDSILCPCCDSVVETCEHSLVVCNFAMSVWERVYRWWKVGDVNAFSIGELFASNGNVDIPNHAIRLWQASSSLPSKAAFRRSAVKFADASVAVVLLCGNPKLVSFEIYHGRCFTPAPSRSYIGGHVSSVDVIDIDKLSLDYGLHPLPVDDDVLELAKHVKDYKIVLVYVKHGSTNLETIFATPKKGVTIVVNNQLRKAPIEIDSSPPNVNVNLTPMCYRNLTKEQEKVSSKDDEGFDVDDHILEDVRNRFSSVPIPSQRSLVNGTKDNGCSVVPEEVTKEVANLLVANGSLKEKIVSTIRLLIAMASIHNLIIYQMDVNTAFLNGDLDDEAPKQWHQKFDEVVLSNGYLLNQADNVYIANLMKLFSMKDMREADVILGIRIKHESNGIAISQSHYMEKVVSQLEYSRVIGCLMYVMTYIRPDIAFAIAAAGKEVEWLKNLLLEIPLWSKPIAPISIRCDSAATLAKAYSQTMGSLDT
ncbi:zinc finger, CCHC-type containing protein [Tanacetum coccineum]